MSIGIFSKDIGIDLGNANLLVYVKDEGIVLNEPSVVVIEKNANKILAAGYNAKMMIGRTPKNIVAIRPLKGGVINDFNATQAMIKLFIKKALPKFSMFKPRVVVSVPMGVTTVEGQAVRQAVLQAGVREAYLVEEPMAAAIGSGLPVHEPIGNMIIDIGSGITEVAVISMGGIVTSNSIRIAGDDMDEAIIHHIKKEHNLLIGERTAEQIKINIGIAYPLEDTKAIKIKGRDLQTGLPREENITSKEIYQALSEPLASISAAIISTLEQTPPDFSVDIINNGIVLVGGGAMLRGIDHLIHMQTGISVYVVNQPLLAVANGSGKILENINVLRKTLLN
ncbi:cell shape determining protein, MreB/Mrl family [Desulfofarcimen acetoxidans DSM 771]|jgi:rod shape-determining protein MreB|uniref:Cell shape-determining protein MreB n=1 Tax=Desulfofarcimen acetoxidans (strain ATCC 49208 / DSM 771 / KCTC 5769 / VKM B-1644 / 5575) TaxID=485916 RepID=C8W524_DESAS|nr:rod shape-determining protein [Desulfofarcimen acetoxidans]ACV61376.1 cell shape determining protein, MreB/Mrl family [Desulfofarcimen acetoxidans DSM 771]